MHFTDLVQKLTEAPAVMPAPVRTRPQAPVPTPTGPTKPQRPSWFPTPSTKPRPKALEVQEDEETLPVDQELASREAAIYRKRKIHHSKITQ